MNHAESSSVIEATSLKTYFHENLSSALQNSDAEISTDTEAYVVNLLVHYSRSDRLFELAGKTRSLKPLALMYGDAVQATSKLERAANLRRLGDVALFVAGMFGPSLNRKAVGLDYYINMGGGAYEWLSSDLENRQSNTTASSTFRELARQFEQLVETLDNLAGNSSLHGDRDLISLYEKWLRTRDPRVARCLKQKGITPGVTSTPTQH